MRFPEGIKLGPADVDMLEYATNRLLDELSITYNVSRDDVERVVIKKIES
jgi:hypothetical protein